MQILCPQHLQLSFVRFSWNFACFLAVICRCAYDLEFLIKSFLTKLQTSFYKDCVWHYGYIFFYDFSENLQVHLLLSYMPYLTQWDKISKNLAHLEGKSNKNSNLTKFSNHFQQIVWRNKQKNHTLLWFSQASYMKKNDFRIYLGTPKWCLRKSLRILSNLP